MIHTSVTHQHMEFIKNLLGIKKLETQINQNKNQATANKTQIRNQATSLKKIKTLLIKPNQTKNHKTKTLQILKNPTSTIALSKSLKIGRSYASKILNQLEKQNKIYKHSKSNRTILYKKR